MAGCGKGSAVRLQVKPRRVYNLDGYRSNSTAAVSGGAGDLVDLRQQGVVAGRGYLNRGGGVVVELGQDVAVRRQGTCGVTVADKSAVAAGAGDVDRLNAVACIRCHDQGCMTPGRDRLVAGRCDAAV